ncbi:MAG: hypothetical protein WA996_02065 [Candidatus Promineifilaceae bacterium]
MASGKRRNGLIGVCLACGSEILFRKRPKRGQLVSCRVCDSLLKVVTFSPLELEWAFEDSPDEVYRDRQGSDADSVDWDYEEFDYSVDDIDGVEDLGSIRGYN